MTARRRPRVLVVEDDDLTRLTLREGLSRDYDVVEAADGHQALAALRSKRPLALAIVDIRLPDTNGLALLKQARKLRARLPVLVVTAFVGAATEEDVRAAGGQAFAVKPIPMRSLRELLARLLRRA